MAEPVDFPGFHYDDGKAEAMADALSATLAQARLAQVTVPDQLAALGIVAARLIVSSRLKTAPQKATQALADFTATYAATRFRQGSPP